MTHVITRKAVANEEDLNRDPITGTPGAHPLGTGAAEAVNPAAEELFWRETFVREPCYVKGRTYEYYAPGFRAGWEGRVRHDGRTFNEAEAELIADYGLTKTELDPAWQDVRSAARAAWDRVDRYWKTS